MQRPARPTTVIRIALHLRGRQGDLLHYYTEYRQTRLYPRTSTDKATKGLLNRIEASEGDGQSQCQDAKRTPGTRRDRDKVTHSVRKIHPRGEQGKKLTPYHMHVGSSVTRGSNSNTRRKPTVQRGNIARMFTDTRCSFPSLEEGTKLRS